MKVGVIGAGASGMMAAITAADNGAEVIVFEKNDRVGQKILATGNGKCNIGNLDFGTEKYYCEDEEKLQEIFSFFSQWDTVTFFESNGMMVRNKNGYLYPYSEQASTVLDIFRKNLKRRAGIQVLTGTEIKTISYDKKKKLFLAECDGNSYEMDKLIFSCGSPASLKKGEHLFGYEMAGHFGHSVKKLVPGLVQLCSKDSFIKGMAGVRTQAGLELYAGDEKLAAEHGELQFTVSGISGIPVFQFSREAAYALSEGKKVTVKINFFPDYDDKVFQYSVHSRYELMENSTLEDFLLGMTNKKINTALIKYAGLKPGEKVSRMGLKGIWEFLQNYRELVVHIEDTNGLENAQVCAGGVPLNEVDKKLQSLKQPGLFLTGELLDVDGRCGGYNLQWAWTSGYVAGKNAAGRLTEDYSKMTEKDF